MRWVWLGWLLAIAATFALFEVYALTHEDGLSLSQFTVDATTAWPPLVFVLGAIVGGLAVHFWWPWVPRQRRETCERCGRAVLKP